MNHRLYHQDIWYTGVKNDISRAFPLIFFKKYSTVNIKILTFFIGPLQQFSFDKYLFFKFISKCQTEILSYVPSSHLYDFLIILKLYVNGKVNDSKENFT